MLTTDTDWFSTADDTPLHPTAALANVLLDALALSDDEGPPSESWLTTLDLLRTHAPDLADEVARIAVDLSTAWRFAVNSREARQVELTR